MKILILGHGRHGKDTVAEYLRDKYGLSFAASSEILANVLKPVLDVVHGERSAQAHFAHRHEHRHLWKALISLYNAADLAALTKLITLLSDCYVGMRSAEEFDASRHLFDEVIWVDATGRVDYCDPTMEIGYDSAMHYLSNSGSRLDLYGNIDALVHRLGLSSSG